MIGMDIDDHLLTNDLMRSIVVRLVLNSMMYSMNDVIACQMMFGCCAVAGNINYLVQLFYVDLVFVLHGNYSVK